MAFEWRVRRRVEFGDVDQSGIVHFPRFFQYMEVAEHEFFRSVGLSIHQPLERGTTGWPRVSAACDFKAPLRFEDMIEVHVILREKRQKSLHWLHVIRKLEPTGLVEVARGTIVTVCIRVVEGEPLKAIAIPLVVAERLEAAPESVIVALG
jgi:YbgC/YbaW family acyl-CoA thioester hydrolase